MTTSSGIRITLPEYMSLIIAQDGNDIELQKTALEREIGATIDVVHRASLSVDLNLVRGAIEVLIGAHAYPVVRPLIELFIQRVLASPLAGRAVREVVIQPVIIQNGDGNTVNITYYDLRTGIETEQDGP